MTRRVGRGMDTPRPEASQAEPAGRDEPEALTVLRVELPEGVSLHETVRQFKRRLIEVVLGETHGNRSAAARRLGIQRTYLHRLVRELEIQIPPGTRPPGRRRRALISPGPELPRAKAHDSVSDHCRLRQAPDTPAHA